MSEQKSASIKQADPSSILLPLNQFPTQAEEKKTCVWINEKGMREGLPCNLSCTHGSDKYCFVHAELAKRRALKEGLPEIKEFVKHHDGPPKINWAQTQQVHEDEDEDISPQDVQRNTETLLKLELLKSMIELISKSFEAL